MTTRAKRPPEIVVAVDSREQTPLDFPASRGMTLATGDYSVPGYEDRVALERKSLGDLLSCVGQGRERFKRQVERLAALEYAALILEPSIDAIRMSPMLATSRMDPRATLQTLLAWSVRYRLPIFFCGDRENARGVVHGLLRHFVRQNGDPDAAAMEALVELGRQAKGGAA